MAAIASSSILRVAPLARCSTSRSSSPAAFAAPRCATPSTSSSVALGASAFVSSGAVGLKSGFSRAAIRPVAGRKPALVARASAVVAAADGATEDKGKTLRIAGYIFGWYFLNAIFGEFHLVCSYRWSRIVGRRSSQALGNRPPRPRSRATLAPTRSVTDPSDEKSYSLSLLTMIFPPTRATEQPS